jgi:hypothetical protein
VSEGVGSWRLVLLGSGILVFAGVLAGLSSCAGSSRWALALGFLAGFGVFRWFGLGLGWRSVMIASSKRILKPKDRSLVDLIFPTISVFGVLLECDFGDFGGFGGR